MGGDLVGLWVVRRVLHRAEIPDFVFLGDDDQTAGVLAGGAANADTPCRKTGFLRPGGSLAPLGQVFFYVAEGGFLRHGADGACPENVGFSEHFDTVSVGFRLIFAGKVQVDIGNLVAAEAQERLKGNVEAVLFKLRAALGADGVRQVGAAAVALGNVEGGVLAFRIGAAVVGREGVDLGDAGHVGNDRRADGATGADQIAMLQRVLHQLLGGHVDHVVVAVDDVVQLGFHAFHHQLRGIVPVKTVEFGVDQIFQVFHGVLDFGSEQVVGDGTQRLAHVGDAVGVGDDHLAGLFLSQIGKFPQHIVRGAEVQGHILVRVVKALGGQQNVTENFVLGVQEVNVSGGDHRFAQFLAQPDDFPVVLPEVFIGFGLVFFVCQHKAVVCQGLDFQKIVKGRNALQLVVAFPVEDGLEQLARFAGGADDQTLPQLKNVGLGHPGHPAEILQIGVGDQMVQVAQTDLILGKNDDVPRLTVGDAAAGAQMGHGGVDGLQVVNVMLLFQFGHELCHN